MLSETVKVTKPAILGGMVPYLYSHDAMAGSLVSVMANTAIMTNQVPVPEGVSPVTAMIITAIGGALPLLVRAALRVLKARKVARAARAEVKAARLRADADPSNDAEAELLEDEAAIARAEADAMDPTPPGGHDLGR